MVTPHQLGSLGTALCPREARIRCERSDVARATTLLKISPDAGGSWLDPLRQSVEELNCPSLQRILCANDQKPLVLDQLFEYLRSVS